MDCILSNGDNKKHNEIYCIIKDLKIHRNIRFVDMVMERK